MCNFNQLTTEKRNNMKPNETFLKENTIKKLSKINNLPYPFKKKYQPLEKGNRKLFKNILSFSLLPVVTCPNCSQCKKSCYDKKALMYQQTRQKRQYNTWLALNHLERLESEIINQIKGSRTVSYIRIHVGGDFFSAAYVDMWCRISAWVAENKPHVKMYTYTRTNHTETLMNSGINVVQSILPDGRQNFGSMEYLNEIREMDNEWKICPVTLGHDVKCGKTCTLCMRQAEVLFVEH
jgi:hypothetical protein